MPLRLVSLLFIFLTIGFFWQIHWQKSLKSPDFLDSVFYAPEKENSIALNEFLILMENGAENKLPLVLDKFNLTLVEPLGEWVHVASRDAAKEQKIGRLDSLGAQENQKILLALEANSFVHSAQLNHIQSDDGGCRACIFRSAPSLSTDDGMIIPQDPLYRFQWHLSADKGINLPQAWAITTGNPNTLIAVVDRNFSLAEPDINPAFCKSRQYYYENVLDYTPQKRPETSKDLEPHGIGVLSVLAPCTDNGLGLAGIDWRAQIFAVDTKGDRSLSARMFGILWAAGMNVCTSSITSCSKGSSFQRNLHPANIINASFGFSGPFLDEPPYGPMLDIIGSINREGRIVVASAGNEGSLADRRLPGSAGGVISVGASDIKARSSVFSNFGRTIDVLAPGENIFGVVKGETVSLNGTSFATPIVSGLVSLMLSVNPDLSWKQAEYILKKTAKPLSCEDYCPSTLKKAMRLECQNLCCEKERSICAAGIVDAEKAVAMAKSGIPKIPLIDFDDYYLPLSELNNLRLKVAVKNWGGQSAQVRMKKTDEYLKIYPESFSLPPIKNGLPSTKDILVYYDHVADIPLVLSLILEAASSQTPTQFTDRIEAIVEIVPDGFAGEKQYNELLN